MAVNWLPSGDLGAEYAHGLQIGSQVAEAQQRLQQEQSRAAAQAQAHTEQLAQDAKIEQARLQTATAYHQQTLELQKQRLAQVQSQNAQKTRQAALALADQHGFAADMAAGMPIEQASFRHPNANVREALAMRTAEEAARQHKAENDQKERTATRLEEREAREAAAKAQPAPLQGTYTLPPATPLGTSPGSVRGPLSALQAQFTTNLPPQMQAPPVPMTLDNAPDWIANPIRATDAAKASAGNQAASGGPDAGGGGFGSPADVKAALQAGKLSRADAAKILQEQFKNHFQ